MTIADVIAVLSSIQHEIHRLENDPARGHTVKILRHILDKRLAREQKKPSADAAGGNTAIEPIEISD